MATREELLMALEQADAQGNITDAEMIARMINEGDYEDVPSLDEDFGKPETPGFFEQHTGEMAGGIAGGIYGGIKGAPYGPWGVIGGSAIGSFVGGAGGDFGQQAYQIGVDSPLAPKSIEESLQRALKAGGEQGMWDLAGSLFFKGGKPIWDVTVGKMWSAVRPKPIEGIEEVIKITEQHGGSLTASQMTSNRLVDTVEGLSGSAWGGQKILEDARRLNDEAIKGYTNSYIKTFNNNTKEVLSDEGIGTLFLNSIEAGKNIHSKMGDEMYKHLDTLHKPLMKKQTVVKEEPTGILGAAGNMIGKKVVTTTEKEMLPVSTTALKEFARKELAKTAGTKQKALGNWSRKELEDILKFDERISFAEAQAYRSKLIAESRSKAPTALGEGKSAGMAKTLSKQADHMIEEAALATKNPEFIAAWRSANQFWKEGAETFSNKFMVSLAQKNGSEIGKHLFNAAPEEIRKAHVALKKAEAFAKGTDDAFSFQQTWLDMQQGYIQKLIADTVSTAPGKAGELSIDKLGKWFVPGTDKAKKLNAVFTPNQRKSLEIFMNNVQKMQKRPQGEGSFMVTVGQAGLVLSMTGLLGDDAEKIAADLPGGAGTYIIAPYVLAKMLVNPKLAKSLAGVTNMSGRAGLGRAAFAAIAKVIGVANEYKLELEGEQ